MILHALMEYYQRKTRDPDSQLAPSGFEWKEIPFLIVLDAAGKLVQIEDTRTPHGKKLRARSFLVPQAVKKTSGIAANLMWDNAEYVLGVPIKGKPERVAEQHAAFKARLASLPQDEPAMQAVQAFLAALPMAELASQPEWEELRTTNPNLCFKLLGDTDTICDRSALIDAVHAANNDTPDDAVQGLCLVTGEHTQIERLHPAIKGVWGSQSTGANIVSFNQRAFESYGKELRQGENAPVGKQAVFAYTTALNHLLGKDSVQRVQVGDASTVFWADRPCELETQLPLFINDPPKDNPDACTQAVKALLKSIQKGALPSLEEPRRFYVLGLSPNVARLSVRYWHHGTVVEMSQRWATWFSDLQIDHAVYEQDCLPLFRLLLATATQDKADNIPNGLAGDIMRAILTGSVYPATMLQAVIRRIHATQTVTYARAALLKAYLNRLARQAASHQEEITVSLNTENKHTGYLLGRLFAVLERVQEEAHDRTLSATIRDRFYGAASTTPVTVFPNLIKLSMHHQTKMEKKQSKEVSQCLQVLEGCFDEIFEKINDISGFPSHMSIEEQGYFAIGYFQQRQVLPRCKNSEQGETA
ncbi:CRISPR-associated protein Csd1 [Chitinivorax tropicus]|uniref:CRISPR-associated protein Csd1 n=1 Tax=Chitinivorax tropicus TaxID=714531 RepID=A0A840ME69_9PROT|nr:type I-C CRISPR-associated protein Cas8c/Csd1 [Chitinivorax tropicus]MBB5016978.1 CRISPR-associated protein Csd1 [Chitinivorax tropicus]